MANKVKKETTKEKPKVVLKETKKEAEKEPAPDKKDVKLEDIKPVVLVKPSKPGTVKLRGLVDKTSGVSIGNFAIAFSKGQEFEVREDIATGLLFMGGVNNKIVEQVELVEEEE